MSRLRHESGARAVWRTADVMRLSFCLYGSGFLIGTLVDFRFMKTWRFGGVSGGRLVRRDRLVLCPQRPEESASAASAKRGSQRGTRAYLLPVSSALVSAIGRGVGSARKSRLLKAPVGVLKVIARGRRGVGVALGASASRRISGGAGCLQGASARASTRRCRRMSSCAAATSAMESTRNRNWVSGTLL